MFSIEYKITDAKQYTLKLSELLLAQKHALLDGYRAMIFSVQMSGKSYMVMAEEDFFELNQSLLDLSREEQ